MSKITGDSACPGCRATPDGFGGFGDKTGNHLLHFEDGNKSCSRCGYFEAAEASNGTTQQANRGTMLTVQDIQALHPAAVPERKLTKETLEHFQCKVGYNEETRDIMDICYPVHKSGVITGYHVRTLPKQFWKTGDTKGAEFFGQSVATSFRRLWVFEGAEDAMSGYQVLREKYPNNPNPPSCIALSGSSQLERLNAQKGFLDKFDEVVLCLDMDEAGQQSTSKIYELLKDVKVWHISENDASDMLMKGKTSELINALFSAKDYTPDSIVIGGTGLESLMQPLKEGLRIPAFPKLNAKLHGFREGEMTIILAAPGVGKTTICREIGYALLKSGAKVLNTYLEEDIKKSQQGYIAKDNNVLLPELRANPKLITSEQWRKSYTELIDNDRTMWLGSFDSIKPDRLMGTYRFAASKGYEFGILDHISFIFSGLETGNERKEIDLLLTEMAAFTKGSKMHNFIVSHVKRTNKVLKKDKQMNVIYPYWDTITSDSARGSGAFEQLGANIIMIEQEIINDEGDRGRVRLRVGKNREFGELGVCDVVKLDKYGNLINAEGFDI